MLTFLLIAILLICLYVILRRGHMIRELRDELANRAGRAEKQRAVIKGQLAEQIFPVMPECSYLPSDMRFLGHPIDFIIFDGLTEAKDNGGYLGDIVFLEVKTGQSKLTRHQVQIKRAVEEGRVRWETVNLELDDDQ